MLVDVLIPKLKATFSLNYTEAMLTQFCFFLAYFVVSVPAGLLVSRIGYLRGIVIGLGGHGRRLPDVLAGRVDGLVPGIMAALFVLAAGITWSGRGQPAGRRYGRPGARAQPVDLTRRSTRSAP